MKIVSFIKRLRNFFSKLSNAIRALDKLTGLFDMILYYNTKALYGRINNPLTRFGQKCFSQTDEDGITIEILRRLDCLSKGTYAEFGVGNGTENNSLILAALGWRGFWVGNQDLLPTIHPRQDGGREHFVYIKDFVTLENVVALADTGIQRIGGGRTTIDVISLDLDGNDFYFVEALLTAGFKPKLFIVEYNAKFPPPVEFVITYNPAHTWKGDDYFGASLASFSKLFIMFGYKLVCCNAHTGGNAFFIDRIYEDKFLDIPNDIETLYQEPRYWLYNKYGHRQSGLTIEKILN